MSWSLFLLISKKLSDAVEKEVVKNTVFDELVKKVKNRL